MSETIEQLLARLRGEYLAEMPARMAEFRAALRAVEEGNTAGVTTLVILFHRLTGSAGAYGFGEVSMVCREMETWLTTGPNLGPAERERVASAIAAIETAFERPPTGLGLAQP